MSMPIYLGYSRSAFI